MLFNLLSCLAATVLAAPAIEKRLLGAPTVTIKNGTVVGSTNGIIDSFNGVPFAQPPVGNLRLKPPQSITKPYGTITATGVPTACPQFGSTDNLNDLPTGVLGQILDLPIVQTASKAGEDCLTVNVQRPAGTNSSSKLPVLFWIYGGGFGMFVYYQISEILLLT
jgi:carboxylesterase type B